MTTPQTENSAALCGCGSMATKLVQMHTHEHDPQPICDDCAAHHEEQAAEVNEHEMKHFGGSYGLVSWTYLPLTHNAGIQPSERSEDRLE